MARKRKVNLTEKTHRVLKWKLSKRPRRSFHFVVEKLDEGEGFDSNMCSEEISLELSDESTS